MSCCKFQAKLANVVEPAPVTDLQVVEAETTASQIKISWTTPTPAPGPITMKAYFDAYELDVTDPADTDFTFTEADSSTPFTAEQSGTCKVRVTVATGEDCADEYSETEVACSTTESTGKKNQPCSY